MPEVFSPLEQPFAVHQADRPYMATSTLGAGYCRTTTYGSRDFRDFCLSIGTKPAFAPVYHPQSNGVVERANGKIFTAIKKRLLDDKKGKWADQLPEVV
jgi:transposase InsO family protein